ncbi:16S rRNA methyltransferase [Alloscardovia theropitheci]|uniref:16S rRNA methyltransferase n=2 Tax=Alloscardovia theropitheci TaxID=2496842 RepID=A0A4R0R1I6_9BIFI|nr:16S rRNA methyltransferase [Alloscardovia theropitheci]
MPAQPANARSIAYSVLTKLDENDSYANLLLPKTLSSVNLSDSDKSFVTDAVYGTLRWRLFLDSVIEAAHKKPLRTINAKLINVVRLGAYQWLFMNIAEYACVNETVNLARKRVGAQTSGFVNSLMRKIVSYDHHQWEVNITSRIRKAEGMSDEDLRIARQAVRFSHPQWVVRELKDAWDAAGYADNNITDNADDGVGTLGNQESARACENPIDAMLRVDNQPPAVTLCVRPSLADIDEVYDDVEENLHGSAQQGSLSPYALRIRGVNPQNIQSVREGRTGVEDEGSQIAALALTLATVESSTSGANEQWLDMCAGPGGKTALLASIASQKGAKISANEPHEHRRELVKDNLKAINTSTIGEITGINGVKFGELKPQYFDRILVDAPCSGLGALRRRPEARWRKSPDSIGQLSQLQHDLLGSALDALKPGGVVAYVTCSPVLAETRHVIDAILSERPDVSRVDVPSIMAKLNANIPLPAAKIDDQPRDMQLFEHIHDTDQMFISILKKNK